MFLLCSCGCGTVLNDFDDEISDGIKDDSVGVFADFVGESSIERCFLNFCDDFLGGGLGGNGERLFFFFFSLTFPSPFTVEFDDDEVRASANAGSPWLSVTWVSTSLEILPARLLVTGGLVNAGLLLCFNLGVVVFDGAMMPGV